MKKILLLILFFLGILSFAQNGEANDCVNYIQICGNQAISLNPNGIGTQEIGDNVCDSEENNSLWIRFTAKTSGTLGFDLIPTNTDIEVDYDFWVFGPNVSCGNIGNSIRCSTTNPMNSGAANNHTGMRDSEPDGDFFEGPGELGDNYIKSLDVIAGESYFLVIDRPIGNGSFNLNWTGTATLDDPFGNAPNNFGNPTEIKVCYEAMTFDLSIFTDEILNSNPDFEVYYYENFNDANYDNNRITAPIPLLLPTYYYRIQSTKTECFKTGKLTVKVMSKNVPGFGMGTCVLEGQNTGFFDLTAADFSLYLTDIISIKYYKTEQEALLHIPGTEIPESQLENYEAPDGTFVYVWIKLSDCEAFSYINLAFYYKTDVNTDLFTDGFCDEDFDGNIVVNLNNIASVILSNPTDFYVACYLPSDPSTIYTDFITITEDTLVNILVQSKYGCPPMDGGQLLLKIKPKIVLSSPNTVELCDENLDGKIEINLFDYAYLFNTSAIPKFFTNLSDAQNNENPINANQAIEGNATFYFRFENSTECPEIGILNIIFKPSPIIPLDDEILVCKNETIELDAGSGFDSYLWSNGSATQFSGPLGVGNYWVELGFNGCIYRKNFSIKEESDIKIGNIVLENNTLSVSVTEGTPPYQYSLDGINWQTTPIFHNLPKGTSYLHTKTAIGCEFIIEIYNINLINAITPNGDGKNDALDFSGIQSKFNVKFQVFDKYGSKIYESSANQLIWDGKIKGKALSTGTYWYIVEWTEPINNQKFTYKSWILVKNR
ncbi:MAG: gliding motility-associated C-terminal domain-containing protein [Flavobacteriaceae bacterium]|jgi:gliding motility-associated-like protein|nr:gliding motility-associated C-terminal domain-containing protein [Flavobacteriaceae bacterium]